MEKNLYDDAMKAIGELKSSVKQQGVETSEFKEKHEKIETALNKFEEQNQKDAIALRNAEKSAKELNERVQTMELEVAKGGSGEVHYKDKPAYKALNKFVKYGLVKITPEEKNTMRMDDNTAGGYLATTEMDTSVLKNITEISPVRSVSKVRTVTKKTLEMPTRPTIPVARYEGEAATGPVSQASYGSESETAFRQTLTVGYTLDLLMDSSFDIDKEVNSDVSTAFAFGEGNNFVLGDAVKKPEGFLSNATIIAGAVESTVSAGVAAVDLITLTGRLKVGYNPMYGFTRRTLAEFRKFASTTGEFIWQAGLAADKPNTINGENYILLPDMPEISDGAGSLAVIYADFARGYQIIDRTGMSLIRDEVTGKKEGIIEVTFHRWNTGKVILKEAFIALKIKA